MGVANYSDVFASSLERRSNPAWVVEYADTMSNTRLFISDANGADLVTARNDLVVPYVTRLRTRLAVDQLDQDLVLRAAQDASPVSNQLEISRELNRPDEVDCDQGCTVGQPKRAGGAASMAAMLCVGLAWVLRRRPRRE